MPTSTTAVLILILFVMPGFLTSRVVGLAYPRKELSEAYLALEAIALSCLNYGLTSWLIVMFWLKHWYMNPLYFAEVAFLVLFIVPVAIGIVTIWISDSAFLQQIRSRFGLTNPVPTGWDHFFRHSGSCWVVATLKSGELIAGLYGPNSAASSYPADEDIYIEKLCRLSPSGEMEELISTSKGAIISMENVQVIEFYDLASGAAHV